MVPATLIARPSKRGPEDQGDREVARQALPPEEVELMDDAPIPTGGREDRKRRASKEAFNEYGPEGHGGDERKGPRLDAIDAVEVNLLVMNRLELEEGKVACVATDDYCRPSLPMTVLEDSTDLSWVQSRNTRLIGEMLSCTDVGLLRDRLNEKLTQSLVDEFVDPAADGSVHEGTGEESIFDYGSPMGLLPDAEGDHWVHDHAASTWARVIVIPREKYLHPDEDQVGGPALEDLGDLRKKITSDGRII